jgi:hypothetical protein
MEAEHVKRVRALLPGQDETPDPTSIAVTEPIKPPVPTIEEFSPLYLDLKRVDATHATMITTEL